MNINEQIKTLNPSVAPALFRRLMRDDDVAYLRDGDGIIGFEILPDSKPISGFALIGMRKHTILSFRGEEKPLRLIIFPSMDKLFNPSMELLSLSAKKIFIDSDSFTGEILGEGTVAELSRELTPPEKDVELPDNLTEKMIRIMLADYSDQEESDVEPAHASPERFLPTDDGADTVVVGTRDADVPKLENPYFNQGEMSQIKGPADVISDQTFLSEHDIVDFTTITFGVNRELLMKLLNNLLLVTQGMTREKRTEQFKLLVKRLLMEKPEVITKHD